MHIAVAVHCYVYSTLGSSAYELPAASGKSEPLLVIIVIPLNDRCTRSHGCDRRGHRGDPGNARHQRRVETNRREAKVLTDPVRIAGC